MPMWSRVGSLWNVAPAWEMSPYVGFIPTTPQYAAGTRTEPP